ncbi:hypothetical protein P7C73_g392, partial [Tremellales sp. Uapishka_1]
MSQHLDYAEISRQARRIVDANRARSVLELAPKQRATAPRRAEKETSQQVGSDGQAEGVWGSEDISPASHTSPRDGQVRSSSRILQDDNNAEDLLSFGMSFTTSQPLNPVEASPASVPSFSKIANSTLLNRRAIKSMTVESRSIPTPQLPIPPRILMIDSILMYVILPYAADVGRAYANDDTLFEFGPSGRSQRLFSNTDVLANAFPSPVARTLFHHYCNVTSRILITMGNIGPNPLLALCTPLSLLDTSSAASAAMRMSMLSTSTTHFAHETAEALGRGGVGVGWKEKRAAMKELGRKFKRAAQSNVLLASASSANGSSHQTDSILAACTLLCIRDVISADPSWRDNLEFALSLIAKNGGPQHMLRESEYSFTRRYLLENLATHDVFSPHQVASLDSQKRRLGISLAGHPDEMWDVGQHFRRECDCLLLELDIWGSSLSSRPQHVRVSILEQPVETPRIADSVSYVLELLSEVSAMRQPVMLIWPLLIAGVFCTPDRRQKVRELFTAFQSDYCEDLEVARELLEEQWTGIDLGLGKRHWNVVMEALGKSVLLI